MWNVTKYLDCKSCLLIKQIQIKEYTVENLAPELKHQKLDKQKLPGKTTERYTLKISQSRNVVQYT